MNIHSDAGVEPGYPVYGGLFREEAIMLLRRFYVQENEKGGLRFGGAYWPVDREGWRGFVLLKV